MIEMELLSVLLPTINILLASASAIMIAWIGFRVKELERNTNSKMDVLLAITASAARAEGRLDAEAGIKRDTPHAS